MRRCRWSDELRQVLAAEEPLSRELSGHVASCTDCTAVLAGGRHFEGNLQSAIDELITDALPPETLAAARMGAPAGRRSQLPRLVLSGVSAAVLLLFAAVGVAATGAGVIGALADRPPVADAEVVHSDFSECYVTQALALPRDDGSSVTTAVEHCLGEASAGGPGADYQTVVLFNREAEETAACLRGRGWNVEPELEPGGRFLIPPISPPAGDSEDAYIHDMEACSTIAR